MLFLLLSVALAADVDFDLRDRRSELYPLAIEYQLPDPGVALGLSASYGFGAGHFYAGDPQAGALHATGQLATLSMGVLGSVMLTMPHDDQRTVGAAVMGFGFGSYGLLRMLDGITAPRTARREGKRLLLTAPEPQ
jgi:hypothetical protein